MSTYVDTQFPIIKPPNSWTIPCSIALILTSALTLFIFIGPHRSIELPRIGNDKTIDIQKKETGVFERTLITNNDNDYLCNADFLYNEVNTNSDDYAFACTQVSSDGSNETERTEMDLECKPGFELSCLVSATYGNTAGSCTELSGAVNGCGVPFDDGPISCEDHSIRCADQMRVGSEFLQCEYDGTMIYGGGGGCQDCAPMCLCGMDSPMFYNVADCFGDRYSTICTQQSGTYDPFSLYFPSAVWERDCVGKQSCSLTLSDNVYQCEDTAGDSQFYYSTINGVAFDDLYKINASYASDCGKMDLKLLAICEMAR